MSMINVNATLQTQQPDTTLAPLKVATDGTSPTTVALPTLDAVARTSLANILAALGALAVTISNFPANYPLPSAQVTALTPPGTVAVSNFPGSVEVSNDAGNPLPISGTVLANTGLAQPLTDAQMRATPVPISGTVAVSGVAIVASVANTTTATLAAGDTFTGAYENVLAYEQQAINVFVRPNVLISGDATDAKGSLFIDYHDSNTGAALTQIPYVVRVPGLFIPQVPITVRAWFRLRYVNDGGASAIAALGLVETAGTPTNQTQMSLTTLLYPQATKELLRTLDQGLSGTDPATLTRAVSEGKNPDGMYVDVAVGGTKTIAPATSVLGANASYTSNWFDTEKYPSVRLLVTADQPSAANGVLLNWSDTPTGVIVRTTEAHNFRAAQIANGMLILASTRARYLQVVYLNGGTAQGRFFLNLRINPVPLTGDVNLITPTGGQTGQQDVTVTTVVLNGGATLPGRKSIRLKNLTTSARSLFYGFTAAMTILNGDELAAGEAIDLDLDESVPLYVICSSVAGGGVRCAWTEIG